MKPIIKLLGIISLIFTISLQSQELNMHTFIGYSANQIVSRMGKPVHKDESNPSMICYFYKTSSTRYVFVSNSKGVYQAEACLSFKYEKDAKKSINRLIQNCLQDEGFTSDTLSTNSYCVHNSKVKVEVSSSENGVTNMFDLRIKATRRE